MCIEYASRFGFDPATMPNDMTLALGSLPATPLDVATGYAVFANGGYKVTPTSSSASRTPWAPPSGRRSRRKCAKAAVREMRPSPRLRPGPRPLRAATAAAPAEPPRTSKVMTLAPPESEQLTPLLSAQRRAPRVITAANAWLMDNIMGDVIKRGTGVRARVLGREDISGKTGTTNDSHDTWFNGFNPDLVATVWVGYDQEQSLGEGEEGRRRGAHLGATSCARPCAACRTYRGRCRRAS